MKMRKCTKFLVIFVCIVFVFLAIPFFSVPSPTYAENFVKEQRSDQNFLVEMTISSRNNTALPRTEKMDQDDGKIRYLCFQWRDLSCLNFHFESRQTEDVQFGEYQFKVTYFEDDRLLPILDSNSEILYQGQVADLTRADFHYYIDKNAVEQSPLNSSGHGYGLYKFDFVYWRTVSEKLEPVVVEDSIYVAVLPDQNILELVESADLRIVYSVSSANHLLNKYNLFLSSDVLKYVKPDRITWLAYGEGIDKLKYVLTQQMQDMDIKLANKFVIWENLDSAKADMHGTSYTLDTKDIEGTWEVECIICDTEGNEILHLKTPSKLSTIKVAQKNYLWLILLIIVAVLLFLFILAMLIMIIMKKRERDKVW